jgi:dGTPase
MSALPRYEGDDSPRFQSRDRILEEDVFRSPYERDAHRILYCDAFRRLRHKAQVFFFPNNDHICTRIEHVLHVAAASCTVARNLDLDVHLTNAIALGHDLGHAPFGHHGETVLTKLAIEHNVNNRIFQHELHGLRVVDRLARLDRESSSGLSLTYAVRDGIISHCGEDPKNDLMPRSPDDKELEQIADKKEAPPPTTYEGCIVRIVDKITWAGRDVEDALQANLINEDKWNDEMADVKEVLGYPNGHIVNKLVSDLIINGRQGHIRLSQGVSDALTRLILWNTDNIYKHVLVKKYMPHIKFWMGMLFEQLLEDINETKRFTLGGDGRQQTSVHGVLKKFILDTKYGEAEHNGQIVLDFIAGMTDNYFLRCISEIFPGSEAFLPRAIT